MLFNAEAPEVKIVFGAFFLSLFVVLEETGSKRLTLKILPPNIMWTDPKLCMCFVLFVFLTSVEMVFFDDRLNQFLLSLSLKTKSCYGNSQG